MSSPKFSGRGLVLPSAFSPWRDQETQAQARSAWSRASDKALAAGFSVRKLESDEALAADFSDLGIDITAVISLAAWLSDCLAPRHASVCTTWANAAPTVKDQLRCVEVAPPRTEVKGSLKAAIQPTLDAALAVHINAWATSIAGFSRFAVRTTSTLRKTT